MKIKDFIDYEQPNEYIVESDRYNIKYSTPVLTAGQSFILGYTNESKGIYKKGPCIIFDDFTTSVHYVDFPFKVKSSAMKILTTKSNTDLKYCYYLLLSLSKMPPNHKRQWISTTSEKTHELPSMDKQIAIVKKLDLISDTIAIYTNQIENLDNLVKARFIEMFGDPKDNQLCWKKYIFKDICTVRQGLQISISKRLKLHEDNSYEYITIQSLHGAKEKEYIKNPSSNVLCTKDDILMTRTGNTGMVITDVEGVFHNNFFLIDFDRIKFNKIFLSEYLKLDYIQAEILRRAGTSTIPDLNHGEFYKIPIYEPPIELQQQFADFVRHVDKSRFDIKKSIIELEREVVYD